MVCSFEGTAQHRHKNHICQGSDPTSTLDRRRRFLVNAAYYAVIVGIVFLVFRYLLNLIGPFFIAFLFAWLLTPAIRFLTLRAHMKYNLAAALCLLVFFALLGGLVVLITSRLVALAAEVTPYLPTFYRDTLAPGLEGLAASVQELVARFDPSAAEQVRQALPSITSSIGSAVTSASMGLFSLLSGWVTKIPSHLISAVICVIATIFMTVDFHRMTAFLLRQVPDRARVVVKESKDALGGILRKYGRGYAIIMGVTFLEMLVGMLVLGMKNAFLIALAIAVFDIFPIVGAGTILVPWCVISLLSGQTARGVGLLVLYVVEVCVRQYIEPRIVGRQIGLHPIITLMSMFVGLKLFGGVGLFGLPITCAIIASLEAAGVIHILRHEEDVRPVSAKNNENPPGST